jgi:hypothetical protein
MATRRETVEEAFDRWTRLKALQETYPTFQPFLEDCMEYLGFKTSWVQRDIGEYLETGPLYRMIQAQRGQAKTTITAIYAVWRLIHDPTTRIVILSAGENMASQISTLIIQIIAGVDILEMLRPDRSNGDRASRENYDVHYSLKGPDKSPSIACFGITSTVQGSRADILIADDVESKKNSQTPVQRELLTDLTRDFTSICSQGDIIYLGTPQSVDSVYNGLPSRGYDIRIWPGRFPTKDEIENYNGFIAPRIMQIVKARPDLQTGGGPMGDRGQAIDDVIVPEDLQVKKEIDQGPAYFQLQHMLDTALMDAGRYPLHVENIFFADLRDSTRAPLDMRLSKSKDHRIPAPAQYPIQQLFHLVPDMGSQYGKYSQTYMYIDPAGGGQNGDETGYAIVREAAGKLFVVKVGGVPGGLAEDVMVDLVKIGLENGVDSVGIERNFGNGALQSVYTPIMHRMCREAGVTPFGVDDPWESGQKELRIIDILEPVIENGRLIIDEQVIEDDWDTCKKYPLQDRATYSLFYQMSRITRDKNCLIHDDRLDALAGAVRYFVDFLAVEAEKSVNKAKQDAYNQMVKNPLGMPSHSNTSAMLPGHKRPTNPLKPTRRF